MAHTPVGLTEEPFRLTFGNTDGTGSPTSQSPFILSFSPPLPNKEKGRGGQLN